MRPSSLHRLRVPKYFSLLKEAFIRKKTLRIIIMSTRINPHQGIWNRAEEADRTHSKPSSFLWANKGTILAISLVASLAIGSSVAGGLLLYFKVNTIAAGCLLGGSGGVLITDTLIGGVILFVRHRKGKGDNREQSSYRIVSWNVATLRDYSNMCFLKNQIQEGRQFLDAYMTLLIGDDYHVSEEEKRARVDLFQEAFGQFGNPDIICLQESWQMKPEDLEAILPEGYSTFSYENPAGRECTIAWNTAKFSKMNHANISYDPEYIRSFNSSPDTIVLLRDNTNGTTLCVGSAHLRGFALSYEVFEEELRKKELQEAQTGDNQTRYDLETMKAVQADLYIFAGDFNVTAEHYPDRLDIIREYGYITDADDSDPTIYDANLTEEDGSPKPAKLDHIFVKGGDGSEVHIQSINLERTP